MPPDLVSSLTVIHFFADIGDSLREGFSMFWETLWALVLGFGLSGAVQAFVSRDEMQLRLGDHRPKSLVRACAYGMVSSSCSYAASAMAKSLFAGGADFLASMVFMFASTNLVIELGMVLAILIGWQFAAAEFIGGVVMIVLLVALGGLWLRGRVLVEARSVVEHADAGHGRVRVDGSLQPGWRQRIRSKAGWSEAAKFAMSDLRMLRNEMAIGFAVAGFLVVLVPVHFWNDLFVHGHGLWTSLENVFVAPFVALLSFVCSIGNVPLAATLWKGGISFGGVVSFVFADLISMPLLLVYKKQYGGRMALRMLIVFWVVMSVAGLGTEYLFKVLGWVPRTRPVAIAGDALRLNCTTVLDIAALVVLACMYWLCRYAQRTGENSSGYAKDPVCGMQVKANQAPAHSDVSGTKVYFCSEHCQDRFERDPNRYVTRGGWLVRGPSMGG